MIQAGLFETDNIPWKLFLLFKDLLFPRSPLLFELPEEDEEESSIRGIMSPTNRAKR